MQSQRFIPLPRFLADVLAASYQDYAHTRVRDQASFEQMKAHILKLYAGLDSPGGRLLPGGRHIDLIRADRQPALRGQPLESPPERPASSPAPEAVAPSQWHDPNGRPITCPQGHVPLPRLTLEQLTGFPTLQHFLSKDGRGGGDPDAEPEVSTHMYARGSQNIANHGGRGVFNVWKPAVDSSLGQSFSLMQMWISSGDATPKQTVEVGWNVYPALYGGDDEPHLFTYFTSNNYQPGSGCYNLTCKGFVQVGTDLTPGMPLSSISVSGGFQAEITLEWSRNSLTGSWWLYFNNAPVGYYPGALFGTGPLSIQANRCSFGCETSGTGSWPPMGSGRFPDAGYRVAAYMRELYYWSVNDRPIASTLTPFQDYPDRYKVQIETPEFGANSLFSGGPG